MHQNKNNIMNSQWTPQLAACGYTRVSGNDAFCGALLAGRDGSYMLLS
jgi:hypothetical protein